MKVESDFVTSATGAAGLPSDGLPEVALIGRSNVGKSSLINALTRTRIARTSAAPGKTRLANVYRVSRGNAGPVYLVDLPGYGYARGGAESARDFEALTRGFFGSAAETAAAARRDDGRAARARVAPRAALLLVDARHPGLDSDARAWQWLNATVAQRAIVATKVDKLPRGQRIRAVRELESVFDESVLPVSAVTGEGLDELWKLIDRLANSRNQPRRNPNRSLPKATAARPPKK